MKSLFLSLIHLSLWQRLLLLLPLITALWGAIYWAVK